MESHGISKPSSSYLSTSQNSSTLDANQPTRSYEGSKPNASYLSVPQKSIKLDGNPPVLSSWKRAKGCSKLEARNLTKAKVDILKTSKLPTVIDRFQELLRQYVEWHALVGRRGTSSCAKVLVWSCWPGVGLGDQIRGAMHALMMAMETDRYLVLDPPETAAVTTSVIPGSINWRPHQNALRDEIMTYDWWRRRKRREFKYAAAFENAVAHHHAVRVVSHAVPHYEQLAQTHWFQTNCNESQVESNPSKKCLYESDVNVRINQVLFKTLFKFDADKQAQAQLQLQRLGLQGTEYAAVHARVGGKLDDPNHPRFNEINKNAEFYAYKLANCVHTISFHSMPVYIASDDEQFKVRVQDELTRMKRRAIVSPILAQHTKQFKALSRSIIDNTVVEMLVMSGSQTIVTTGSGFSFLASFTGNASLVHVNECGV